MSFLNPVNESVLRFSSTDANAPQINYNARTAGDVKAVLKACLVTGYGAVASAGWSVVNEVDNVCEFVSPSVAMSDYRLGINDTSASSTTWYYQYQDARVNPAKNVLNKSFMYVNKASNNNGWQLLVTDRGIVFVEVLYSTTVNKKVARMTYFGQTKTMLAGASNQNIAFFNIGASAASADPQSFFTSTTSNTHYNISGLTAISFAAANIDMFTNNMSWYSSTVDMVAPLYLRNGANMVAEQPAILLKKVNKEDDLYGVYDDVVSLRPVLHVLAAFSDANANYMNDFSRAFNIYLDYWEF